MRKAGTGGDWFQPLIKMEKNSIKTTSSFQKSRIFAARLEQQI